MFEWKYIVKGLLMGITELIPGVSSATIAMILGIYERFIAALNSLTSKNWKEHLGFLIPLGIGIGTALVLFARVMKWLLESFPQPTLTFFLGLILGVIPYLLKSVRFQRHFRPLHYTILILSALLVALTSLIQEERTVTVLTNLRSADYLLLFASGWLASSFMVLPGISGALVFLLLGVYPTILAAIESFNLFIILVVGSGIILGALLTSKLIRYLFIHFQISTYAAMIGLIIGSCFVVYPRGTWTLPLLMTSCLTFLMGLFVAITLSRTRQS